MRVHKLVIDGGEQYLPVGRSIVSKWQQRGLKYAVTHQSFPDAEMHVKLIGEDAFITITGGCPKYPSGLVDFGAIIEIPGDPNPDDKVKKLFQFHPTPEYYERALKPGDLPSGWQNRDGPQTKPWATFGFAPPGPGLFPPLPNPKWENTSEVAQIYHLKPSMYTGHMRKVIQVLLGIGKEIKYGYTFERSHGVIHVASTKDGKPINIPYLVEISKANGVLVTKLPYCNASITAENTLTYVPIGGGLPFEKTSEDGESKIEDPEALAEAIADGRVQQVITPAAMKEFYDQSPFFAECGWAFSYDTMEAANTCWNWPEKYKVASLYVISFIENEGKFSASMRRTLTGLMFGQSGIPYPHGQFQVPNYAANRLETFDMMWEGYLNEAHTVDSECPLYVWYEKGGGQKTVQWSWTKTRPASDFDNPFPPGYTKDNIRSYDMAYDSGPFITYSSASYIGRYQSLSSPIFEFAQSRFDAFYEMYEYEKFRPLPWYILSLSFNTTLWTLAGVTTSAWTGKWFGNCTTRNLTVQGENLRFTENVVAPLFEREAIYHFRRKVRRNVYEYKFTDTRSLDLPTAYPYRREYRVEVNSTTNIIIRVYAVTAAPANPIPALSPPYIVSASAFVVSYWPTSPGEMAIFDTIHNDSPGFKGLAADNVVQITGYLPEKVTITNNKEQERTIDIIFRRNGKNTSLPINTEKGNPEVDRWTLSSPQSFWENKMWAFSNAEFSVGFASIKPTEFALNNTLAINPSYPLDQTAGSSLRLNFIGDF